MLGTPLIILCYFLAIESSCDETAAAVVRDGREVLSNIIASQVQDHAVFGGVVPEIASRKHLEAIVPGGRRGTAHCRRHASPISAGWP